MNDERQVTSGKKDAFTLIEIMIVVAIIGLMAAMGLPSILSSVQKEGMRKALSDVQDVCFEARKDAIMGNQRTSVVFYPAENRFAVEGGGSGGQSGSVGKTRSATLPSDIQFALLDINLQDYLESPVARVFFYPNGTSDEMRLVLLGRGEREKITLEFSTALTSVSDVDK